MKRMFSVTVAEDESELLQAYVNGPSYKSTVENLDTWLRNKAKYEGIEVLSVEAVRDELRRILDVWDLTL